jgi:hypothetical protein
MSCAGTVYGIAIAVYFVKMERVRSVGRVLWFILVSSYSAAVLAGSALGEVWPWKAAGGMTWSILDIPLPVLMAGMLGAFLVMFAALYLFCPMVSETRVLKLALAGRAVSWQFSAGVWLLCFSATL